ncbi:MAG: peroxide stress protein YaaA [Saprospiraceae bacterium]
MIILLSPAKSLNFDKINHNGVSQPRLLYDTEQLIKILSKKSTKSLQKLMHISENIANENETRYKSFEIDHRSDNSKPAILAFNGDVYKGLNTSNLTQDDLHFAQEHVRILSGLYGLLRPMDLIQPHRLEMGTKLNNRRGKNIYKFWGDRITKLLNDDIINSGSGLVVNLASNEYFSSINKKKLKEQLLTINFKEYRGDELKFISFNAKRARGLMTQYIIKNKLTKKEKLLRFNLENYEFSEEYSTEDSWIFLR